MLVVCNVDNLVKGIIINRCGGSSLPFVIVFISVIGGAFAFGFLGVFIGPVIMTLLASMIRAYMNGDSEPAGGKPQEQDCTASADSETEQVPSSGGAPEEMVAQKAEESRRTLPFPEMKKAGLPARPSEEALSASLRLLPCSLTLRFSPVTRFRACPSC